jgi:hypothetical protein
LNQKEETKNSKKKMDQAAIPTYKTIDGKVYRLEKIDGKLCWVYREKRGGISKSLQEGKTKPTPGTEIPVWRPM